MNRERTLFRFLVVWAVLAACVAVAFGFLKSREPAGDNETQSAAAGSAQTRNPRAVPTRDPAKAPLPNILVITIDSLRSDYLGVNGNPTAKTPNLDALARQGANFTLAISAFSQTNPSHASLFTGTYPATHKSKLQCVDPISESVVTLAEVLGENGYSTSAVYSWPCFEWSFGFDRGFDLFRPLYVKVAEAKEIDQRVDGRADVTTNGVLDWIGGKPAMPYFLWIHYQDPHYPYTPPPPFDKMPDNDCQDCLDGGWDTIDRIHAGLPLREGDVRRIRAAYAGEISFTDQEIGRLLHEMRRAGLLDDTMVIVTSDHGEALDDNGLWFHPLILHNSVIRVPLIVSYPPSITPGSTVDAVVRSVDVMPTILETAGIPLPAQIEGQSLWPLIRGTERGRDRTAFVEVVDDSEIAVVTDEWKLIGNLGTGSHSLFNIRSDPAESSDLAAAFPQQVLAMEQVLKAWLASHGMTWAR